MREARETLAQPARDTIALYLQRVCGFTLAAGIDNATDILTALSSAGIDCEGWRDIESAPKDGTIVLVGVRHSLGYSWGYGQYVKKGGIQGWVCNGGGVFGTLGLGNPQYWMAVPPLPPLASGGG